MNVLDVSASPHVRDHASTREIILDVYVAIVPTTVYGVVQFGIHSLFVISMIALAAVFPGYLWRRGMKKEVMITDCSVAVTGPTLALNMSSEILLWIPALGAVFAIITAKQMFSGLGQNFMNSALAGRCLLLISLAKYTNNFASKSINFDATIGAAPLAVMKTAPKVGAPVTVDVNLFQPFMGHIPGTIGEASAIALLLGVTYLLWGKVISLEILVIYIVTTAIFASIFGGCSLNYVLAQASGGGLIFDAFLMATDYASTPLTKKGQMIYAVITGILTGLFRIFDTGVKGVSYSTIIGNMLSPLIEGTTIPKVFGRREVKKAWARQKKLRL